MAYIGSTPTSQNFTSGTDYFSGTGSQTAYTLTRTVNSVNDIEVVINNVVQQPSTAYTLSGTTITFTSAPSSGTNNIYVRYLATNMQSFTVPANSISRTHLDSNLQAGFQGRNKIINGHMVVDQRNAGASISANDGKYPLDRFKFNNQNDGLGTGQQVTTAPAGFSYSLKFTSTAATTIGTNDTYGVVQNIEGYNIADLAWGTANAKTVTLSFWVQSSLTGTFGGIIKNNPATRNYAFTYSIPTANTWTQISVTIAGDQSGTWLSTNGVGMQVVFGLANGSGVSIAAGSWQAGNNWSATGAVQVLATNGATWAVTGVQLEEGTTATSFEREAYSVTLQKCQRYYFKAEHTGSTAKLGMIYNSSLNRAVVQYDLPVKMRASPSATYTIGLGTANSEYLTVDFVQIYLTVTTNAYLNSFAASAEL